MAELGEIIAAEIRKAGSIAFARFMELALYCPVYGYYEAEKDNLGRRGDYYTSVSVGPLFGELLAWQFVDWAIGSGQGTKTLEIVEAGAHDGRLARDILNALARRALPFNSVSYVIVEPSQCRQSWQQQTLEDFKDRVRWVRFLSDLPDARHDAGHLRILFCNELLDALPVHRVSWDARARSWFEWGVALEENRFAWVRLPLRAGSDTRAGLEHWLRMAAQQSPNSVAKLEAVLPQNYTVELCLAAEQWWREAAGCVQDGKLVAIDYGLTIEELFSPERPNGTLRAYRAHRLTTNLLDAPGKQDLTAHVNFARLQQVGQDCGLNTVAFTTQERFLTRVGARLGEAAVWTPQRKREFLTLTHPEHLGTRFRVLVQEKSHAPYRACSS